LRKANLFICFFILSFSTTLFAEDKTLVIATAPFAPFRIVTTGQVTGCDADIVREVLMRIGYIVAFRVMPFKRAWHETQHGKISGFVSLTKNPEREKFVYYTDQLSTVKDVFFKRKSDNITWKNFEDLKEYVVGESGYNYAQEFKDALRQQIFEKIQTIKSENPELLHLRKLKAGRIDLFISEISVGQYLIKSNEPYFDTIDYINKPIGQVRPFFATFSKKWPGAKELVEEFNLELKKFVAEGKRKVVFERYGIVTDLE